MGKVLQIRVSAYTYNQDDVQKMWKNLYALAWHQPPISGEKRGVFELVTSLADGLAFEDWSKSMVKALRPGIERAENLKHQLEQALADWDPRTANRLSDELEDSLSDLEDLAPPE